MKFYSEKLNALYDTEKALVEAETAHDKKIAEEKARKEKIANERAVRAKEVEEAYKAVANAQKIYKEKLTAFTQDYGSFHMTLRDGEMNLFDLFDSLHF